MPTRKDLKGISAGIAFSFSSRNNDIDGYWAMGILYKVASEAGTNKFKLNLMSGESDPIFKYSWRVASPYQVYLTDQIEKKGLEEYQVTEAIIDLEFGIQPTTHQETYRPTWGEIFSCRVIITDDLGKKHIFEKRSWCGQHDPKKERRSTRRYAY